MAIRDSIELHHDVAWMEIVDAKVLMMKQCSTKFS